MNNSLTTTTMETKVSPWEKPGGTLGMIVAGLAVGGGCILLYKIAWTHGITESGSLELWAVPLNVIALLWVAPYQPLLGMVQGSLSLCGYLIVFLTPIVASGLGYFASFHNFDLNAKIHSLAYEKKKDKEEF
jgi:hypothetical protein